MSVEIVLILGMYAFIMMGVFLGPAGPLGTFKKSGPRLAARIERNITIGNQFRSLNGETADWKEK